MATIRQWVAWAESGLARVVEGEGLHVGLAQVIEGPAVVTFRLRLLKPDRRSLDRLLALGPTFAQALQVEGVRVSDSAKGILVEVPSPSPKSPSAAMLATATQGLAVAVGLDAGRKPVVVRLEDTPSIAWVGPTGRGKSAAMRSTVFALASRNPRRRLLFVVLAPKRGDWSAFEPAATCLSVVSDPGEAIEVMQWAAGDLLQERARSGSRWPAILFVVDDLANLLQRSPDLAGPLGEVVSMGRGAGLFVLLGTQHAGSKAGSGGPLIDDNLSARVVYKPATATAGARSAGFGGLGLDQLSGRKGDALFVGDGRVERIATAVVDDRTIAQLPAGEVGRPWAARSVARSDRPLQNGLERPQNALERPRTGWNGAERAVLPPLPAGDVGASEGGGAERNGPFLSASRPPNAAERGELRALFARLGSREKVYRAAWGFKNGKVAEWLRLALEEGEAAVAQVEPPPASGGLGYASRVDGAEPYPKAGDSLRLDLSTDEGRAAWEALIRSGAVRLPDVAALVN